MPKKVADTTPRRARERTGTLERAGSWPDGSPRWRGRVRLEDGTKSERFDVPRKNSRNEATARAWLATIQAGEDESGELLAIKRDAARKHAAEIVAPHDLETADAWFLRYVTHRSADVRTKDMRDHWRRWISPVLGDKPIRALARADAEAVRNGLDDAIRAGKLRPKSAQNMWGTLTRAMKEATSSKDPTLRVFELSPCVNVQPPIKGESRRKAFFYPKEIVALVTCEAIPLASRFTYACAAYLGLRPNELAALRWSDVQAGAPSLVHVSSAVDWDSGESKAPKTSAGIRIVPVPKGIERWLAHERAKHGPADLVCPLVAAHGKHRIAGIFRADLAIAGVNDPRLFRSDRVWMPVGFRSLRDTYATWLAVAGVNPGAMQRRLGHKSFEMSAHYAKVAEDLSGTLGEVFPEVFPVYQAGPAVDQPGQSVDQNAIGPERCQGVTGGGAGNRTRVRELRSQPSTRVSGLLHRPGSRRPAGSSQGYSPV